VRACDRFEQRRWVEPLLHVDVVSGLAQKIKAAVCDGFGH
jgi:hypothetical protein